MKDLTHYFQSPGSVNDSVVLFPDSSHKIVHEVSQLANIKLTNIENKVMDSPEKVGKAGSSEILRKEKTFSHISAAGSSECSKTDSVCTSGTEDGKHSGSVNGNIVVSETEKACKGAVGETVMELDKKENTEVIDLVLTEENSVSTSQTKSNGLLGNEQSPNAFQILMSTQQVFSSSNNGKKECPDDMDDSATVKKENRKKIKDNLEKMAKRKLEMEESASMSENLVEKPRRKRRKIVIETDSDEEVNNLEQKISSDNIAEKVKNNTRKRKKPELKLTTGKRSRNVKPIHETSDVQGEDKLSPSQIVNKTVKESMESEKDFSKKAKKKNTEQFDEQKNTQAKSENITEKVIDTSKMNDSQLVKEHIQAKHVAYKPIGGNESPSSNESCALDNSEVGKRKSNILNYFNKIPSEMSKQHSEKIKVTADVHFPLTSPGKLSKTVRSTKKKSKRKGKSEIEDDIQLIDTEVIEKPDICEVKVLKTPVNNLKQAARAPAEESCDKGSTQTESNSPIARSSLTSSAKAWKIQLRGSHSSSEDSPSPLRQHRKGTGKIPKKLNLAFDKTQNKDMIQNAFKRASSTRKEPAKKNEDHSVVKTPMKEKSTTSVDKQKTRPGKVSTPVKKGTVSVEHVDNVEQKNRHVEKGSPAAKKSSTTVGKGMTKVSRSEKSKSCHTPISPRKNSNSKKSASSSMETEPVPLKKVPTSAKKGTSDLKKDATQVKKASKPSRKASVITMKVSRHSKSPVHDKQDDEVDLEKCVNPIEKKTTPLRSSRTSQKKCSTPTAEVDLSVTSISCIEASLSSTRRMSTRVRTQSAKEMSPPKAVSDWLRKHSASRSNSNRSARKKAASPISIIGISDDDDEEDYDEDEEDYDEDLDFDDDDDDDYEDSDDYDDDYDYDDDDDDEPIFEVKRKKIDVSKQMSLEKKIVMQFVKKARETLSKSLSSCQFSEPLEKTDEKANSGSDTPKLAPVFLSKKTKCLDKVSVQARKTFLESGVPEVVRKMVEIQKLAEEQEHVVFPSVSHVQQKDDTASVWNLPDGLQRFSTAPWNPTQHETLKMPINVFIKYTKLENEGEAVYSASRPAKIKQFREFLRAIKAESPDFPVYRTFRQLLGTTSPQKADAGKGGKRGRRRNSAGNKKGQLNDVQNTVCPQVPWTSKYRPLSSEHILGNSQSVKRLKKWLELWVQVKENTLQKHFKEDCSSGDEFINDSDEDSGKPALPKNPIVIIGPTGSGKTMTVYTVARELGYKVLEVNAASKRTGRRILSELMEATQSHQVHGKGDEGTSGIKSFFSANKKSEKEKTPKKKEVEQQSSKLSLILVEDVDIVFEEEDEGFVSALSTLVAASKRPIILVSSDTSCPHLARFMENSLVLTFIPGPCKTIGVWLQLVCLLEGVRVKRTCVEELLAFNKGDVRKTLLHLQFWVLSGGDNGHGVPLSSELTALQDFPDDLSNSSWVSVDDKKAKNEMSYHFHSNCLGSFLDMDSFLVQVDRDKLWWNLPQLVGLPLASHSVLEEQELVDNGESNGDVVNVEGPAETGDSEKTTAVEAKAETSKWKSVCCPKDMKAVTELSDTLSLIEGFRPRAISGSGWCLWKKEPTDSLSLQQDMKTSWYGVERTAEAISSWLVAGSIGQCATQLQPEQNLSQAFDLQKQAPSREIRWREEQHCASRELANAVPHFCWSERNAMAVDYIPSLRNISRLEQDRSCFSSKRNNRFYHYLKGLGVTPSPSVLDTACNAFHFNINS